MGLDEKRKTSEARDETICLGDSTQTWSPKARLKEVYSRHITPNSNAIQNYITKPSLLLKSSPEETSSCCVPIRVDLISAFSQTEFNICPTINSSGISTTEENMSPIKHNRSATMKWKGGVKHLKTNKIRSGSTDLDFRTASTLTSQQHSVGATGTVSVTKKDSDDRNWTLESDLHSVSVRFSLLFKDINKIPRNHLR